MERQAAAAGAIVIGGGFYGATIAHYLASERGIGRVLLMDKADALLTRASRHNQARVHNGYHYPRSFTTAYRSRVNMPRFVRDFPLAVKGDFTALYAIARRNSRVTARQFERFCHEIGAPLMPVPAALRSMFDARLVDAVYAVEEYAFDSTLLASWAERALAEAGVQTLLDTEATAIVRGAAGLQVRARSGAQPGAAWNCRYVFNCTYSAMNQLGGDFPGTSMGLKQEITEMALLAMPPELAGVGITLMDGPFFSTMPFPARGLHTLSHVRYTPHIGWNDSPADHPHLRLDKYDRSTRVERMLRDAARYVPAIARAQYRESLFEVKTVLAKNEGDDGRPILFERHAELPGCYSILGGKIDNIYDVLEKLDAELFLSGDVDGKRS